MEKLLIKGDVYTVATKTECTVTSANGTPLGKATAENPVSFTATTDRVELSDPDAEFARVNPKYAPVKLRLLGLLGGGVQSVLPRGYLAAEFLENKVGGSNILLPMSDVGNTAPGFEIEHDVQFLGTKDTIWGFGIGGWDYWRVASNTYYCMEAYARVNVDVVMRRRMVKFARSAGKTTLSADGKSTSGTRETITANEYGIFYIHYGYAQSAARLFGMKVTETGNVTRELIPAIDNTGAPCLYDKVSKTTFKGANVKTFIIGLDIKQALKLAKLPAGGGTLTVSLPWEAQLLITGVPDALQAAADNGWTITVQYREPEADSELYNKYAACKNMQAIIAVDANYADDVTAEGEWIYPLPALTSMYAYTEEWWKGKIRRFCVPLPNVTNMYRAFSSPGCYVQHIELDMPKCTYLNWLYQAGRPSYAKITAPECTSAETAFGSWLGIQNLSVLLDMPKLQKANSMFGTVTSFKVLELTTESIVQANSMYAGGGIKGGCHVPTAYPSLSTGSNMFNKCQLTGQQAVEICQSIPQWDDGAAHAITLGIHVDYQADDEVLSAIAEAEAKGWTLAVQWNGTATAQAASTFGMRRPPIYAKLGTHELPDGTSEATLDWGHYVTDWEANGYQEFSSVEEAKEYFNIKETNHETF